MRSPLNSNQCQLCSLRVRILDYRYIDTIAIYYLQHDEKSHTCVHDRNVPRWWTGTNESVNYTLEYKIWTGLAQC